MDTQSQPFLDIPKKSKTSLKIIILTTFFALILTSSFLLLTNTLKENQATITLSHVCQRAQEPATCHNLLSEVSPKEVISPDAITLLRKFLAKQTHLINAAISRTHRLQTKLNHPPNHRGPLADCVELMDQSMDLVLASMEAHKVADVQAWLSAVLTNHVACSDGLDSSARESMGTVLEDLISRAKASLALLAAADYEPPCDEVVGSSLRGKLPSWVTARDRLLLERSGNEIKADLVVAKDGSGNYKTVAEAIAAAPNKGKSRYVIHVKKGTYKENVEVGKGKKNLMIVGDGMSSTIITGSLNVVDGSTTFNSATLAAVGESVILQDLWIQNTAGPEKHQAVALRVGADKSVINRCKIDAYQDTLYAHSLRQFYRECNITGTVDFIFGNAAVVFQKCYLIPRKPGANQQNMVTAQGRTDPNQNTGTSIQDCYVTPSADLQPSKASVKSYLGRPWKEYSRTVVMQSYIDNVIDPSGWAPWSGDFALNTLYYGEYSNRGPGAGISKRVNWPGYHVITDKNEAAKFTVKELIQGGTWLSSTGVAYTEGL